MNRRISKWFFLLISSLIFTTGYLLAQTPPSVDVDAANMQIAQFENENRSLEVDIILLEESIDRLEEEISVWSRWKSGIERIATLLTDQADRLNDVLSQIGSRSIVERAQSALQQYDRIEGLLEEKILELTGRIAAAEALVERHTKTVALYRIRFEQNLRNISLLRSAIMKSASAESSIETILNDLDAMLQNATILLTAPDERTNQMQSEPDSQQDSSTAPDVKKIEVDLSGVTSDDPADE